jgi:protein-tyrosine phosphatase
MREHTRSEENMRWWSAFCLRGNTIPFGSRKERTLKSKCEKVPAAGRINRDSFVPWRHTLRNKRQRKKAPTSNPTMGDADKSATIPPESIVNDSLMGEIVPGLWIGNLWSVKELAKMPDKRWTIVSLLKSAKLSYFLEKSVDDMRNDHSKMIIQSEEWALADQSQANLISARLSEILELMDESINPDENRACLVHCAFGVSRSAAVCAAWLIARRQMSLQQAMEQIRVVRPEASPNMGFVASLRALEQSGGNVEEAQQRTQQIQKTPIGDRWAL